MFYSNKESNTPWRNHLNRSYYGYGYEATTLQNQGWDIPSADVLELDDQFILELALPGVVSTEACSSSAYLKQPLLSAFQ